MTHITEDAIKQITLAWFANIGYEIACAPEASEGIVNRFVGRIVGGKG